jgi:hypothetical protein
VKGIQANTSLRISSRSTDGLTATTIRQMPASAFSMVAVAWDCCLIVDRSFRHYAVLGCMTKGDASNINPTQ